MRHTRSLLMLAVLACAGLLVVSYTRAQTEDRPPRPPRLAPREPQLTDEQVEIAMELVGYSRPELAERLAKLKTEDPQAYRGAVQRVVSQERIRHLLMFHETDPEGFELRATEWRADALGARLARRLRQAEGDEAATLKKELRVAVESQFDARLKVREHELALLEKRLESLRHRLRESRDNRDRFIEEQYQRMLETERGPKRPSPSP